MSDYILVDRDELLKAIGERHGTAAIPYMRRWLAKYGVPVPDRTTGGPMKHKVGDRVLVEAVITGVHDAHGEWYDAVIPLGGDGWSADVERSQAVLLDPSNIAYPLTRREDR
jgi:hypothetical protein